MFILDDRKKWIEERKKIEHTLKTMGSYPFVLGLSKKKRVRAISEVLKHRNDQVHLRTRPSTTKPRRSKGKKLNKLRSISTSQLGRPNTSVTATRMSRSPPGSPSNTNAHVSFGLDGMEPPPAFISPLTVDADHQHHEQQQQQPLSEILFDLVDTNNDGLLTKDELIVAVTENIEIQSMLEAHQELSTLLAPTTVWMDVFDNVITKNVNGEVNVDEFKIFLSKIL